MKHTLLCIVLTTGFILSASANVLADEGEQQKDQVLSKDRTLSMESITVTANKIEENPQDIPMSITAFDEIEVSDRSIEQTTDIFQRAPNMHMTKMGPNGLSENIASVRGITSFMTGGSVFGFFVDDVDDGGLRIPAV